MAFHRLITKCFQLYWRTTRGLTLGAQALVLDDSQQVLLVRHGYRPGWHFPGGGVEWNETLETALVRELDEETGIRLNAPPELYGVFANFRAFPGDHVALFTISHWHRERIPEPNREIAEARFFARHNLPEGTVGAVHRRLGEIFDGEPKREDW